MIDWPYALIRRDRVDVAFFRISSSIIVGEKPASSGWGTSRAAATMSRACPATEAGERGGMPEVTISLEGHAEELAVFGSRDQYLRQIRDALGVKVLARHGEVRIEGDSERIEQARRIFEGLRSLFRVRKADLVRAT